MRGASPRMTKASDVTRTNLVLIAFRRIVDLPGIFDHLDLPDIDVDELAVALLDPADIDILDHIPLVRIDYDRSARAVELLALHEIDVLGAVRIWAELRDRLVDQFGPVPGRNRSDIRNGFLAKHLHKLCLE